MATEKLAGLGYNVWKRFVDNTQAIFAVFKANTRDPLIRQIVKRESALLEDRIATTWYVASKRNLADLPTRKETRGPFLKSLQERRATLLAITRADFGWFLAATKEQVRLRDEARRKRV